MRLHGSSSDGSMCMCMCMVNRMVRIDMNGFASGVQVRTAVCSDCVVDDSPSVESASKPSRVAMRHANRKYPFKLHAGG